MKPISVIRSNGAHTKFNMKTFGNRVFIKKTYSHAIFKQAELKINLRQLVSTYKHR